MAKSFIERGSGRFPSARPAVSSAELQYSHSRLCSLCNRNHCEILAVKFSLVRLRVRLSWSTQILFRHVLGLRTPLPRQGDVTDSFSSVHPYISALVVKGSGRTYSDRLQGEIYRWVGILCPCLLGLVRIHYYLRGEVCFMFSLSRYFSLVLPAGGLWNERYFSYLIWQISLHQLWGKGLGMSMMRLKL